MKSATTNVGPIHILSVEDSPLDFELIQKMILSAGYQAHLERVETKEGFVAALQSHDYDLILADFNLPSFNAFEAIEIKQEICPKTPLMVMSGSIGEETAIELIKIGAVDYILKDRPKRLASSIKRALEEVRHKKAREHAEETLKNNYRLMRQAGQMARFGGWDVDLKTNRCNWSEIVAEIHGLPKDFTPTIEQAIELYAPEWQERISNVFQRCAQEGAPYDEEMEIISQSDKRRVWVRTLGEPVRDSSGAIIAVQGTIQDITAKKQTAMALQESETRFQTLVSNLPGVVYLCKNDSRYTMTYLTREVEALTGYAAEDFTEERISFTDLYHPEDLPEIREKVNQGVRQQRPFHLVYRLQRRDGQWRWIEEWGVGVFQNNQLRFLEGFMIDITERKETENALAESERIFNVALKNAPVTVFQQDSDLRYTWIHNPHSDKQREDIIGMTDAERFSPEDAEKLTAIKKLVLESGKSQHEIIKTSGMGLPEYQELTIEPVKEADGTVSGVTCSSVDITRFINAEKAQRKRLAELESIRRISQTFQKAHSIEKALPVFLDETLAALGLHAGCIYLYNLETSSLRMEVSQGWFKNIQVEMIISHQGITGKIFATGKPYLSREFRADPSVNPVTVNEIPKGWGGIGIPIRAYKETIGVIFVSCQLPREIQPYEISFLESLAEIAGISMHRMTLLDAALQRLEKLKAQHTIDQAIASLYDLSLTLDIICQQAINRVPADAVGILLYKAHDQTLTYAASAGFKTDVYQNAKLKINHKTYAGRAALEQQTIHEDIHTGSGSWEGLKAISVEGFTCYTGVPLIAKGQIKGVLETFHYNHFHHNEEWLNDLETLAAQTAIAIDTHQVYDQLQRSNLELNNAYDATIEGWSQALEYRDQETEGHTLRVTELTLKLAQTLGVKESDLTNLRYGALLHDIGKIGIPDSILLKPGPLDDEEWQIMKQHPQMAYNMLSAIDYLRPALDIPLYHHEKWDGSGYPSGLKGKQIPLAARIFAVVDVWDALRSDRPYRKAWPAEKTRDYIQTESGHHFDPDIVKAFFDILQET